MPAPILAKDFPKFAKTLAGRIKRQSLRPALVKMKRIGERSIGENFRGARRSTGEKWAPRKRKYPHPPLIKTGRMMRSATREGTEGHIEEVGQRHAWSGSSVFYSKFHQFGNSRLPARQFEELPDSAVDMMGEALADYITEKIFNA